ncbi:protein argonaute-2-like isoform X2 [Neocloeon triangulifer]|uniref:protein argonaute-2-like isoform X2 n=1 Tax=Neocloeon triangulifer TaxID=2078957 RepID=UPI00286F848C|nr:protein argonaute-2-like isoform X2 [Neocloeon triangulifer]
MNNPDLYVSMALDDVIKYRRNEGGRGGRGGRGRGGRGARGGQQMQRNQYQRGGRGGGGGFPQRSPGGRVAKNRMVNPGMRQPMPFRGGRGGPMPPRGFPQRGRGAPRGAPQFNPRLGLTTQNNPMNMGNMGGRLRAWTTDAPQPHPMPAMAVPVRGRRGGPRGAMRGRGRGGQMRGQRVQQQPQQQQYIQQEVYPQQMQQQYQQQPVQQLQAPQQQRFRTPRVNQVYKAQIAQELKSSTQTARNRVRLAAQVLMQRKRQLDQLTKQTVVAERQAGFKTRGLRLQGKTQRVTGLRRGGGVVQGQVDARQTIKQKIVRASVNRQRNLQRAQNQQMQVNMPNTRMQQQLQQQQMPQQQLQPRPMPARGFAVQAVRRAAAYRRGQRGQRGGFRGQKQLTLHERFSHQAY